MHGAGSTRTEFCDKECHPIWHDHIWLGPTCAGIKACVRFEVLIVLKLCRHLGDRVGTGISRVQCWRKWNVLRCETIDIDAFPLGIESSNVSLVRRERRDLVDSLCHDEGETIAILSRTENRWHDERMTSVAAPGAICRPSSPFLWTFNAKRRFPHMTHYVRDFGFSRTRSDFYVIWDVWGKISKHSAARPTTGAV